MIEEVTQQTKFSKPAHLAELYMAGVVRLLVRFEGYMDELRTEYYELVIRTRALFIFLSRSL